MKAKSIVVAALLSLFAAVSFAAPAPGAQHHHHHHKHHVHHSVHR